MTVRGHHVLDVGCGAGRVSLYLQSKGFRVTAIENSPLAIRTCGQRGVKNAGVLAFEQIERIRDAGFDTVVISATTLDCSGASGRRGRS